MNSYLQPRQMHSNNRQQQQQSIDFSQQQQQPPLHFTAPAQCMSPFVPKQLSFKTEQSEPSSKWVQLTMSSLSHTKATKSNDFRGKENLQPILPPDSLHHSHQHSGTTHSTKQQRFPSQSSMKGIESNQILSPGTAFVSQYQSTQSTKNLHNDSKVVSAILISETCSDQKANAWSTRYAEEYTECLPNRIERFYSTAQPPSTQSYNSGQTELDELAKYKRFFLESGVQNEKLRLEVSELQAENEVLRFRLSQMLQIPPQRQQENLNEIRKENSHLKMVFEESCSIIKNAEFQITSLQRSLKEKDNELSILQRSGTGYGRTMREWSDEEGLRWMRDKTSEMNRIVESLRDYYGSGASRLSSCIEELTQFIDIQLLEIVTHAQNAKSHQSKFQQQQQQLNEQQQQQQQQPQKQECKLINGKKVDIKTSVVNEDLLQMLLMQAHSFERSFNTIIQ